HDMCYGLKRIASSKDLVIIISLSGESETVVELAKALRTGNIQTVSITALTNNRLAALCGENLYINSVRLPVKYKIDYESSTPYFILIEYLYLSYQNYLIHRKNK
ncbi:MAG: SIS domain-containing protein, partial [Eubacterium sp.]|nr:SIS domain-containing protein [Eubacterium sp.]